MRKKFKIPLIVISLILISGLIGTYIFFNLFGKAFGSECSYTNEWNVQEYTIKEKKCLGWAGPHFYRVDLFKNDRKVDTDRFKTDSCQFVFYPRERIKLVLDICEKKVEKLKTEH